MPVPFPRVPRVRTPGIEPGRPDGDDGAVSGVRSALRLSPGRSPNLRSRRPPPRSPHPRPRRPEAPSCTRPAATGRPGAATRCTTQGTRRVSRAPTTGTISRFSSAAPSTTATLSCPRQGMAHSATVAKCAPLSTARSCENHTRVLPSGRTAATAPNASIASATRARTSRSFSVQRDVRQVRRGRTVEAEHEPEPARRVVEASMLDRHRDRASESISSGAGAPDGSRRGDAVLGESRDSRHAPVRDVEDEDRGVDAAHELFAPLLPPPPLAPPPLLLLSAVRRRFGRSIRRRRPPTTVSSGGLRGGIRRRGLRDVRDAAFRGAPADAPERPVDAHGAVRLWGRVSLAREPRRPPGSRRACSAPRSPSSLPLLTTMRLFPDGDTLDARTPRSSVPNGGWYRGVDAPLPPCRRHRRDRSSAPVGDEVALRRGDAQGEPGGSRGSLCSDAPAAKGRGRERLEQRGLGLDDGVVVAGFPADIAVARC